MYWRWNWQQNKASTIKQINLLLINQGAPPSTLNHNLVSMETNDKPLCPTSAARWPQLVPSSVAPASSSVSLVSVEEHRSCDHHVTSMWPSCDHHVTIMWPACILWTMWLSCDCHYVSLHLYTLALPEVVQNLHLSEPLLKWREKSETWANICCEHYCPHTKVSQVCRAVYNPLSCLNQLR